METENKGLNGHSFNVSVKPEVNLADTREPYPEELEPWTWDDYTPHYVHYEEKLKGNMLDNLEELTGLKYKAPHNERDPNAGPDAFLDFRWVGEEITVPLFVQRIVDAGKREQAAGYIDFEIRELTLRIKDHPESRGRIAPYPQDDDTERFWEEDYHSDEMQQEMEVLQRLEIERLFRAWLINIRRLLYIKQPTVSEPETNNKPDTPADGKEKETGGVDKLMKTEFSHYLTDKGRDLLPALKRLSRGAKPQHFAILLWALYDLGLLRLKPTEVETTSIHQALGRCFGDVGDRWGLGRNINNLSGANNLQNSKIEALKVEIRKELATLNR